MEDLNLVAALDEQTARRIKAWPHPSNRASEAGHPCKRFLVLARLAPEKKTLHDIGLQRIFDEGNLQEEAVLRELQGAGVTIVEQQRPFTWPKFELSGRIDAKIANNGGYIPLEVKSCSPHIFPSIKETSPEDMVKSRYLWVRKYPAQILLYELMDGNEPGYMLFKNKTTGEKCQKIFRLSDVNLLYAESVLQKLEEVNDYVHRGEVPPLEPCEECRGCGFEKTVCFPGRDYGPGYDFLNDQELLDKLLRREELQPAAKEYKGLDEDVKAALAGRNAIIGDFLVESKQFERKGFDVPADIKKAYETVTTYWKMTIARL